MNLFIDRREEMDFLDQRYQSKKAEFVVIYGRRRVGKSELIKQFSKDKSSVYFLATRTTKYHHLKKFLAKISSFFGDYPPEINSWEECFDYFTKKLDKNKKIILIIDEFPYLIESNKEIPSLFQLFWDEYLKDKNVFLVLLGSSIGMMETEVLGKKSPLYGRRTGQIKLQPFKFKDVLKFYPKLPIEGVIGFYSVVGNIPLYLLEFNQNKSVLENIRDKILTKKELLNEEANFLLKEELRDPSTYQAILEAMATSTKATEIAQKAHLELHNLDRYLKILLKLDLIYKEFPVTVKKLKSKKTYYDIKDNFLDFWYKFCFPNSSLIEENPDFLVKRIIKPNLNTYIGKKFEKIGKEFLWELNRKERLPFIFTKIGRQWGKIPGAAKNKNQFEIDFCAINEKTKEILFCECKWKNKVNARKVIKELAGKVEYVQWYNKERREIYAVFAKSFNKKIKKWQGKQVCCFDLKDLKKVFRK